MIWLTDPSIEKPDKVVDRSNRYGSLTCNNALRRGLRWNGALVAIAVERMPVQVTPIRPSGPFGSICVALAVRCGREAISCNGG